MKYAISARKMLICNQFFFCKNNHYIVIVDVSNFHLSARSSSFFSHFFFNFTGHFFMNDPVSRKNLRMEQLISSPERRQIRPDTFALRRCYTRSDKELSIAFPSSEFILNLPPIIHGRVFIQSEGKFFMIGNLQMELDDKLLTNLIRVSAQMVSWLFTAFRP